MTELLAGVIGAVIGALLAGWASHVLSGVRDNRETKRDQFDRTLTSVTTLLDLAIEGQTVFFWPHERGKLPPPGNCAQLKSDFIRIQGQTVPALNTAGALDLLSNKEIQSIISTLKDDLFTVFSKMAELHNADKYGSDDLNWEVTELTTKVKVELAKARGRL